MAKPLTSWLVPSFPQHNLCPVVAGCCLHFSVRKLQDKFTSLRQVNSPNSWEKFQICCTDMYLIRFLPNFAVFCVFLWISRLCDGAKYQKPWLWAASFTLYELQGFWYFARSRTREIQVFPRNPAKFPQKSEIPRNPPEIFPNRCRQNIFNTYLGY